MRLVASKVHFEAAFFDTELTGEKPYSAVRALLSNQPQREVVTALLKGLIDHEAPLPDGCIQWEKFEQLEAAFAI